MGWNCVIELELKDTSTLCPRNKENGENLGGCTEKKNWICYKVRILVNKQYAWWFSITYNNVMYHDYLWHQPKKFH
jgi:hypothetical protein